MKQEGGNMNPNKTQLLKFSFTNAESWHRSFITINVVIAVPKCSQTKLSLYLRKPKLLNLCVNGHIFIFTFFFFPDRTSIETPAFFQEQWSLKESRPELNS